MTIRYVLNYVPRPFNCEKPGKPAFFGAGLENLSSEEIEILKVKLFGAYLRFVDKPVGRYDRTTIFEKDGKVVFRAVVCCEGAGCEPAFNL